MAGLDSIGSQNPALYAKQNALAGYNDDFMYNAYLSQQNTPQTISTPSFSGGYAGDTFEKQGSSPLATGIKLGILGGVGAGAGAYFFGGEKLGMNVYKDGNFNDAFLKSLEDENVAIQKAKELRLEKIKNITGVELTEAQVNALKEVAAGKEWPRDIVKPNNFSNITKDAAEGYVKEINKISAEEIVQEVARKHTLEGSKDYLKQLNARNSKLASLTAESDLAKHVQENANLYGIKGSTEAELKTAAENFVNGKTLEQLKAETQNAITTQEGVVNGIRQKLTGNLGSYLNDAKNGFKDGAPENAIKALKRFKLSKAGKVGLITAGIAAGVGLLGSLFFGNKS